MSDLDDLERRKKELELRRDIRRLERGDRAARKLSDVTEGAKDVASQVASNISERSVQSGKWSWLWVAPLGLFGAYLVLGGLVDGPIVLAGIGGALLVPIWFKVSGKK